MAYGKRGGSAGKREFGNWRDLSPMNVSVGGMLHNLTGSWRFIRPVYEDKTPACQNACPAGNDIEAFIRLIQKDEYEKAYWHLKREEPFPAVLGRVCFRFCQDACNRGPLDEWVGVGDLERFVGDHVPRAKVPPDLAEYHGQTLAVVGSGPAGMSAAYFARLLGFRVTIFEALPVLGGLLRVGIPNYRLPKTVVEAEFEGLKAMGVTLRPGVAVGRDIPFEELAGRHDFVFLAAGAHAIRMLDLPGSAGARVMSGLDLLKKTALGEPVDLGRKVAVVGGGNTAIDTARTAARLGAEVTVIYRRSERDMPAHADEVRAAREEGVAFRFLAEPDRVECRLNGDADRLVCGEMVPGEPDAGGRPRPVRKPGSEFEIEADVILTAVGEDPDPDLARLSAGRDNVFAGGDMVPGPRTVAHAVASSKRAAVAMDCRRLGRDAEAVLKEIEIGAGPAISFSRYMNWQPLNPVRLNIKKVVDAEKIVYDYLSPMPPVEREATDPAVRMASFEPYEPTFTRPEARHEADRCLHCGRCVECDNCLVFCPEMSVMVKGEGCFGYDIDYDYCKGCGICWAECPRCAVTMVEEKADKEESV